MSDKIPGHSASAHIIAWAESKQDLRMHSLGLEAILHHSLQCLIDGYVELVTADNLCGLHSAGYRVCRIPFPHQVGVDEGVV